MHVYVVITFRFHHETNALSLVISCYPAKDVIILCFLKYTLCMIPPECALTTFDIKKIPKSQKIDKQELNFFKCIQPAQLVQRSPFTYLISRLCLNLCHNEHPIRTMSYHFPAACHSNVDEGTTTLAPPTGGCQYSGMIWFSGRDNRLTIICIALMNIVAYIF